MVKNESDNAKLLILDEEGKKILLEPGEEYPKKNSKKKKGDN